MNILVIGNGFDLAHGLPTKYGDFLEFCERVKKIYEFREDTSLSDYKSNCIADWKMNDYIKTALLEAFEKRKCKIIPTGGITRRVEVTIPNKALEELYKHIRQNTWLEYFLKCRSFVGENWIDFESEISKVIQALDKAMALMKNEEDITKLSGNNTKIIKKIVEEAKKDDGESLHIDCGRGNGLPVFHTAKSVAADAIVIDQGIFRDASLFHCLPKVIVADHRNPSVILIV